MSPWERSGSVVDCLTRDRGAAGSSFAGVSALCPCARHINPSLVLVQPRKTRPNITGRLLKDIAFYFRMHIQDLGWVVFCLCSCYELDIKDEIYFVLEILCYEHQIYALSPRYQPYLRMDCILFYNFLNMNFILRMECIVF